MGLRMGIGSGGEKVGGSALGFRVREGSVRFRIGFWVLWREGKSKEWVLRALLEQGHDASFLALG